MSTLLGLRKFVAPEIIFGKDARKLAGRYADQYSASKVLIVSDKGVIDAGWIADVEQSLSEVGIAYHIFSQITPNPRVEEVMKGAEIYNTEGCNLIIAIGGGSPMDCAKGIGIVSSHKRHILEFEGVDKIKMAVPPFIFIPTTAGTSADVSQFCIISNLDELVKIAIISKAIVPDVALIDPVTTTTMPPYLTACTGIDALVHAIEAFVSTGNGSLTDMCAIEAIKLISRNLVNLLNDINNIDLRDKIMMASLKAGLAFSNASLGAVHAMAHSLGGFLDLSHGECNAMLLEHVIDFNYSFASERYKEIAKAMDIAIEGLQSNDIKRALVDTIIKLKRDVGIVNQLGTKGVKKTDISQLSDHAIKDACMLTNPRKPTKRDIEVVFENAL